MIWLRGLSCSRTTGEASVASAVPGATTTGETNFGAAAASLAAVSGDSSRRGFGFFDSDCEGDSNTSREAVPAGTAGTFSAAHIVAVESNNDAIDKRLIGIRLWAKLNGCETST